MHLGCDVDRLDHLSTILGRAATTLESARSDLVGEDAATTWHGPDRRRVVADLERAVADTDRLAHRLRELAAVARTQAETQRRVSGVVRPALDDAPLTVLSVDGVGDGHAVVAIGDVSTATHLVVLVPGMGSDLGNLDRLLADARRLQHRADIRAGAGRSVAVIAWLGYDAPAGLDDPTAIGQVLRRGRADAGAAALRSFLDELPHRDDAFVTVIGHSYGSLVVAGAARANDDVDQVVVLGSPGVGVDDVDDLGLAPGTTFFAAAFDADLVAASQWFGRNPASAAFGARRLETGTWPHADPPGPLHAHSAYFDECSQSLDNLARLVIGETPR